MNVKMCSKHRLLFRKILNKFPLYTERPPVVLAFLEEPDDVTVTAGSPASSEVRLRCVLKEPDPLGVAVWFFNSKPLDAKSHPNAEQSFDGRTAELRLCSVSEKEAGVYSCGVKNGQHTCICMCRLNVEREMSVENGEDVDGAISVKIK